MGATGLVSATGGYNQPTPPDNPLMKVLWWQQRLTLGPVAGIADEVQMRAQGYDPQSFIDAARGGYQEAKSFDSIVKNPWLAFALNVGADPVSWIPSSWIINGAKGVGRGAKAAGVVIGLDKSAHYASAMKRLDAFDIAVRSKIGGGPNYEFMKRNPQAVRDALFQRNVDFEDFVNTFISDSQEDIVRLVESEDEMFKLHDLLISRPYAKSAVESVNGMDPILLSKYNALSAGGKTAYRVAWETDTTLKAIRNSREMRTMDSYKALQDRIREQYKTFTSTPHEALANELGLADVIARMGNTEGDIVKKLTPARAATDIVNLIPDIQKEYKGLATLAVGARNLKEFQKAVRELTPGSLERGVADMIKRDEAILKLRELAKMYRIADLPPGAAAEIGMFADIGSTEAEQVLSWLIMNKGKSEAKSAWQLLSKKPVFRAITKGGSLSNKGFPLPKDVRKVLNQMPLSTDYHDLSDFYTKMRNATRINERPLADVLADFGKAMPPELEPGMSLDEIKQTRDVLMGLMDPEAVAKSQEVWDKLNANRFNGLPINVIRNANMDQIAKMNLDQIEIRMAAALGVDGIATARAVSNDNLHRWLFKWLNEKGLMIPADEFADLGKRTAYFKNLKDILPPEEYAQRAREGFAEVTSHPFFSGFAIPKTIAKEINSYTRVASNPARVEQFFQMWGKYQGLWKAFQLAIFPSYHFRNAVSNVWNNFLAGLSTPKDLQYYWEAYRLQQKMGFKGFTKGKIAADLSKEELALIRDLRRGVIGGEYSGELGHVLDEANPFRHKYALKNLTSHNPAIKKGFDVGRIIEDNARIAHYLKMRHGEKLSHLDAVKSVHKYLFDWRQGLTKFEDKYLRNFLVPFYGWTRFNLPLQVQMLAMQPGKYSGVLKATQAYENQWGGPDPDTQFQADWFKQAFNVRVRYNEQNGTYEYFFLDSWLPAADISKIMSMPLFRDMIVQLLSPGIKTIPIEAVFNYNLYKKRKVEEYEGQRIPLHLPGGKTFHVPAHVEHLVRQWRLVNEVDRFFDESLNLSEEARWQRLFVGRSYPYDPAKQENWWKWKLNTQVRELEGHYDRAIEKGDEAEAERILKMLDELHSLQDYYE